MYAIDIVIFVLTYLNYILIVVYLFILQALEELNGSSLDGATLEVSLAKPPSDKKKKEEILRARERRMFTNMQGRAFG